MYLRVSQACGSDKQSFISLSQHKLMGARGSKHGGCRRQIYYFPSSFQGQNSVTWSHLIAEAAGKCGLAGRPGRRGNCRYWWSWAGVSRAGTLQILSLTHMTILADMLSYPHCTDCATEALLITRIPTKFPCSYMTSSCSFNLNPLSCDMELNNAIIQKNEMRWHR